MTDPNPIDPSPVNFTISDQTQKVEFAYTNWKGETRQRKAIFFRMFRGSNEWHPEAQWLVSGLDLEKDAMRTFALKDITDIKRIPKT